MELLQAGVDRAVIALWLGHESVETTQIYLDADLALKEAGPGKNQAHQKQSWTLSSRRRLACVSERTLIKLSGLCLMIETNELLQSRAATALEATCRAPTRHSPGCCIVPAMLHEA